MLTLFDIEPTLPTGFSYFPNFITEIEEAQLINSIGRFDLQNMKFHEYEARRKVVSFGQGWSFTEQKLKPGIPIPEEFHFLLERISKKLCIPPTEIAQLLITEYPPGSVINWHRDAPPFNIIAGVSLLADCNFKLRPHEKAKQIRNATISLPVQRRSLYAMQAIVKSDWEHSTAPGAYVRYSLTFRTLKN